MSAIDHAVSLIGDRAARSTDQADGLPTSAVQTQPVAQTMKVGSIAQDLNPASDFRRWSSRHLRLLVLYDALVGGLAVTMSTLSPSTLHPDTIGEWLILLSVGAAAWPLWVAVTSGYHRRHIGSAQGQVWTVIRALMVAVLLTALPTSWFGFDRILASIAVSAPIAAVISIVIRSIWCRHIQLRQRSGNHRQQMIMVGSVDSVVELAESISRDQPGVEIVGACVPTGDLARAEAAGLPVVGDLDQVAEATRTLGCHAVAVTGSIATRQAFLRQLAWSLEDLHIDLLVHPGLVDVAGPRVHIQPYKWLPLLHVEQPHFDGWRRGVKRALDVLLTGVGLVVIWPLLLLIAVLIKVDDRKGPVFFRQVRVGVDGKPFTIYKFRTMCTDAEERLAQLREANEGAGLLFKMENDPRVTRVGRLLRRLSLDELPQLFNILGGSMSLVGPRPSLPTEVDNYTEKIRRRLKVMPGLTGLWQVSGRSMLSWEESVRLDLWYVENWSIGQDLKIIFKTAQAVMAQRGAY